MNHGALRIVAQNVAEWGIARNVCANESTKGSLAPFCGGAKQTEKVSRDMGYEPRDMGPRGPRLVQGLSRYLRGLYLLPPWDLSFVASGPLKDALSKSTKCRAWAIQHWIGFLGDRFRVAGRESDFPFPGTSLTVDFKSLSGTGDCARDSRESIRANHSQLKTLFL